jgi:hypothetical protein
MSDWHGADRLEPEAKETVMNTVNSVALKIVACAVAAVAFNAAIVAAGIAAIWTL